jgi:hypothetical protein
MTTIRILLEVPPKVLADTFCSVVETPGCTDYWQLKLGITQSALKKFGHTWYAEEKFWSNFGRYSINAQYLCPDTDKIIERTLRASNVNHGLERMARNQVRHFADLLSGNGDMTTADVMMQMILFYETKYG